MINLLLAFKQYLLSLKLSPISRKLYLADIRHFLAWLGLEPTQAQLTSPLSYSSYMASLRTQAIAPSMLKRTVASLRQFGSFIALTYHVDNPVSNYSSAPKSSIDNYIKHFTNYLVSVHLSPLTIKSYKSDVTRYLDWVSKELPSTEFSKLLSTKNIGKYLNHLSDSGNAIPSTIERKDKSIARFKAWYEDIYAETHIPDNANTESFTRSRSSNTHAAIEALATTETYPEVDKNYVKNINSRKFPFSLVPNFNSTSLRNFSIVVVLMVFASALGIFSYRQFTRDVTLTSAYPSTPVTPNRQLSFQGRLENAAGTPISSATNFTFKLYDAATLGTQLYTSGVCSITPDADGVFSTQIGSTCGSAIASTVFSENANVWLEVTVVSDILTPRQQIASVAYALNSETLQGFPISSTVSAIRNTVVPMNQWGEIIVGEQSPRLKGVSGTFQISAPSLSFITTAGSNGNISFAPDGTGQINATGNTTSTNFFNVSDAQLTTGSLITGTVANANTGYKLIDLLSGASPTSKFSVSDAGNTIIGGTLTLPNSNTFTGVTNYFQASQGLSVGGGTTYYLNSTGDLNANTISTGGTQRIDASGNLTNIGTTQFHGVTYTWPAADGTNTYVLQTNGSGTLSWVAQTGGGTNLWRINLGDLSPVNDTLDLTLGSNATSSAKIGLININSGTPTATISGSTANVYTFLDGNGNLSTTNRQSLTFGNSATYNSTGNILLNPNGTGNVGIANLTPTYKLDVTGDINLTGALRAGGSAGTSGYLLTSGGGGVNTWTDPSSLGGGTQYWRSSLGALSPLSDTYDLLVGNAATSSAKFGFINVNTGTPTATISAGTANNATYVKGTGFIGTTNKQTLTIGEAATGNIVLAPGGTTALTAIGSGLTAAGSLGVGASFSNANWLEIAAATTAKAQINLTSSAGTNPSSPASGDIWWNGTNLNFRSASATVDLLAGAIGGGLWTDGGTYLYPTSGETLGNSVSGGANKVAGIYLADSAPLTFGNNNNIAFSFLGSTLGSVLTSGTMIGIGTTTGLATLDVRGSLGTIPVASFSGNTSMAAVVVDQSGSGDIFTASSSGNPRFVVKGNGNVGIGVSNPTNILEIGGSTSTISNASGDITISAASGNVSLGGGSLINILNTYMSGSLGVGLASTDAKLQVHGAIVGKALAIFNEIGDQDIFTASASGVTKFRITHAGNVSIYSSGYLNFGLTDGTSGYGIRDNGGSIEFKNSGGSWSAIGSAANNWWNQTLGTLQPYNSTVDLLVGGTATTSAKFAFVNVNSGTPTASISAGTAGSTYLTATGILATTAKQTLALGDATTTGNIILQGGNVGIGITAPVQALEVNGYTVAQRFVDSAGSSAYYLDPAATGTSLSIDGNIVSNGAFSITSNGNNAITIDAGSASVVIGSAGLGKLDAGTIDPPYTINGEKFATYMAGMTGVKEETTGTIDTSEYIAGVGYRATLNFANSPAGSDLWLFNKATNLKANISNLVALLSPAANTRAWYDVDAAAGKLYLYTAAPTTLSYRLTAPRYDADNWGNRREGDASAGHIINDNVDWTTTSAALADNIVPAAFEEALNAKVVQAVSLKTDLISPLASGSAITINGPVVIKGQSLSNSSESTLTIDGELEASTVSARTAYLTNIQADTITARSIVADTISANHIEGLDAKIASLSGNLSDSQITSITDRIKARLAELTGNVATATDLPTPPEATMTASIQTDLSTLPSTASDSGILGFLTADSMIINNYLAVIGSATITNLDVTSNLYTSSIQSKSNLLALQPMGGIINLANNTLIVDSAGEVAVNGNLTVQGKILAQSGDFGTLSLGTPSSASQSALGQLLSVYNEKGEAVATIDASGSANLASLTTNLITIASPSDASESATASALAQALSTSTKTNATAGVATLISPNTSLEIVSPYITPDSLVYLTPTTNTDNKVLFVKSKSANSFTVGIDAPAATDISFNWWIIKLAPPKQAGSTL